MSVLDYHRRLRLINTIVADANLQYYEGPEVKVPCTDGRTIRMPTFNPTFTELEEQRWMFSLLHECYHVCGTNRRDFDLIRSRDINMGSEFGHVLNITVDHNIEIKRQGVYEGADKWIKLTYEHFTAEHVKNNRAAQMPDAIAAVWAFDVIARSSWLLSTDHNIKDVLSDDARDRLEKLLAAPDLLADYLTPRDGGEPNYEMAKRLFDEQGESGEQKAQEGSRQGDGQGQGDGTKKGQSSGSGQQGDSQGGASSPSTTNSQVEYQVSPHDGQALGANEMGGNQTIIYKPEDFRARGDYQPSTVEEVIPSIGVGTQCRASHVLAAVPTALSGKVRNLLKVHSQVRYQGGQSRGKINKRAIARVSSGYDRVWRKKQQKDVLDTAVMVLVDCSGSMGGTKYVHAVASALGLNECLSKINVPHEIIGFTYMHSTSTSIAYMHKGMNEKVDQDTLLERMTSESVRMACNSDGDSINHAHDRLMRSKAKRKVMIVLSDGQPAAQDGAPEYLLRVVREIEQKSPVELYGIGIEDHSVRDFYTNCTVINTASELEGALLTTIKTLMLN